MTADNGQLFSWIAGVDEAGRGPLAGPVMAAAVILHPDRPIAGLADSKELSPKRREALYIQIVERAQAYAIGRAEVAEIDHLNILQASLLAMSRAVQALQVIPGIVWVDGNQPPRLPMPVRTLIQGDRDGGPISAASILAKVCRDREMARLAVLYPDYGFERHQGYPTAAHVAALMRHGPSPIHRLSYAPVRRALAGAAL
ncbi:MAG: ribonuclease HII [Candidatus Macondimonas sp.]